MNENELKQESIEELVRKYRIIPEKIKYILQKYGSMSNFCQTLISGDLSEEDIEFLKKNLNMYIDIQNGANRQCGELLELVLPQYLKGKFLIYDSGALLSKLDDYSKRFNSLNVDTARLVRECYGIPDGNRQTYRTLAGKYGRTEKSIETQVCRARSNIQKGMANVIPGMFGRGEVCIWNADVDIPQNNTDFRAGDSDRATEIIFKICDSSLIFYPDEEYIDKPESITQEQLRLLTEELMLIIDRRYSENSFRDPNSIASLSISAMSISALLQEGIDIDADIDCLFELSKSKFKSLPYDDRIVIEAALKKRYKELANGRISFRFKNISETQMNAWKSTDYDSFVEKETDKFSGKRNMSFDDYMALLENEPASIILEYGQNTVPIIAGSYEAYCKLRRCGIKDVSDFAGKKLKEFLNGNEEFIDSVQSRFQAVQIFEGRIKSVLERNRADVLGRMKIGLDSIKAINRGLLRNMHDKKVETVGDFLRAFEMRMVIDRLGHDTAFAILEELRRKGIISRSNVSQESALNERIESLTLKLDSVNESIRLKESSKKSSKKLGELTEKKRELECELDRLIQQVKLAKELHDVWQEKLFGNDISILYGEN